MLEIARILSLLIQVYLGLGLIFGVWFAFGMTRDEPIATLITRLMLIPGAMLLWPYLLLTGPRS